MNAFFFWKLKYFFKFQQGIIAIRWGFLVNSTTLICFNLSNLILWRYKPVVLNLTFDVVCYQEWWFNFSLVKKKKTIHELSCLRNFPKFRYFICKGLLKSSYTFNEVSSLKHLVSPVAGPALSGRNTLFLLRFLVSRSTTIFLFSPPPTSSVSMAPPPLRISTIKWASYIVITKTGKCCVRLVNYCCDVSKVVISTAEGRHPGVV